MPGQRRCGNTMINAWFLCLPLPLALTRTALEQSGARGGSNSAPFFGTCALPLLERRGARTCRGLGVMHGPSKGGPAQWAVAKTHAVTDAEVGWWLARHRLVSPAQCLARRTLSTAMESLDFLPSCSSPADSYRASRAYRDMQARPRDLRGRGMKGEGLWSFLQRKRPAPWRCDGGEATLPEKGFLASSAPVEPTNFPRSHQDIASWLELRILPRKDPRRSPPQ